ncbi:MAG TPA: hypothetical protein VF525_03795 [Pyrinomonadaceae bacterium]|jgi:hypothetical protein
MFCPKCGDELTETRGELTCVRGEMSMSQYLSVQFKDCYERQVRAPREMPLSSGIGGDWFCPGCGIPAPEEPKGVVRCQQCGRSLNEFLYQLIERCAHRRDRSEAS